VNLLYVLFIVCVPFCANLMPSIPAPGSVLLYGIVVVGAGLALYLNVWYAQRFGCWATRTQTRWPLEEEDLTGHGRVCGGGFNGLHRTRISLSVYVFVSLFYVFPPKTTVPSR